jgi:hypothetical protein
MNGPTIRRCAAGLGLVAVTASVPTAALAFATPPEPPDPCRMNPLPLSCFFPMTAGSSETASTTVVTAVVGPSLTSVTATYIPLTATVSGKPIALAPTAAVATPTVNGTPTPMTFTLPARTTGSAIPPWMPPRQ